jgi:hypothetical protein
VEPFERRDDPPSSGPIFLAIVVLRGREAFLRGEDLWTNPHSCEIDC